MDDNRESFIFYRSFYEAIKDLPKKNQLEIFTSICEMSLNFQEIELKGLSGTIFKLIKPQIEANNKRYKNGLKGAKYGSLGGRPKKPQENPKETPNKNVNDNDNVNDNKNIKRNTKEKEINIIEDYQNNIGSCSPFIYEQLVELENDYGSLKVQQAIKIAVSNGKKTLNYIKGILNQWGDKSWDEILKGRDKTSTNWFNKEIKSKPLTAEEEKEMEELLNEFKD